MKYISYLGLVFAIIYIIIGSYLLLGEYVFDNFYKIPNGNIFGMLLVFYGIFRLYRFYSLSKKSSGL